MELKWSDLVIDKRAVNASPANLMAEWLWLVPAGSDPMLPTVCGDIFLHCPDGRVAFLDTYAGKCEIVASNYEVWKQMVTTGNHPDEWFKVGLVADLLAAGIKPSPGQCFSPLIPPFVNGTWKPTNFQACDLVVHLTVLGQMLHSVQDLPPGTRISRFDVKSPHR